MNRPLVIVAVIAVMAAAAIVAVFISSGNAKPAMTEEQRAARERFFGTKKEWPPIEKGQEMRPRW